MALTYAIEGKGVIANADNYTTDTAGGSWGVTGSGGASAGTTTDTYYYGTTSISSAVSGNNKWAWIYHDIGAGNELDFGAAGTEENQFIYIWVHCPTTGLSKTLANEGVSIRVGSGTAAYRTFIIAGSDATNGWDGGWQCFVIDPTKTGSIADTGTPNLSSIRYIGPQMETTATAKGDNLFVSQIAVGSGLRITGTSTTGWLDAVTYCTDLANRAWGMLQEREGVYYGYGNIIVGSPTMTGNCSFVDSGRVLQFGISEYWSGTGTTFNTSLPTTASGITLEDDNVATAYTTTFGDGVLVGTDNGRSGSTFIGNANESVFFEASGLANTGSDINLYGTTFKTFTGVNNLESDLNHAYYGVTWQGCSQVVPAGAPVIRNCTFAETADIDAALLWNSTIDITDCNFIANTLGAAIEMVETTNQDYDTLLFSGNTNDTLLNNGTPGTNIDISKTNGSNPTTYENAPSNTATITYVGAAVTVQVTTQTGGGTAVGSCRVFLVASDGTGPFPFEEAVTLNATASTTVTATHTAHGMSSGDKVVIYDAADQNANGVFSITVTTANAYTYTARATVTLSADAATATFVALEGVTNATTGILSTSRVYASAQPVTGWARKSSGAPYYKSAPIAGSVSATTGLLATAVMIPDE
ncbi:MAG: hypothetical protein KJO69_03525 [Gammaproteobacteria bacterium]|nr:hypothetical protein [Gammaproteobacteria bacterium]